MCECMRPALWRTVIDCDNTVEKGARADTLIHCTRLTSRLGTPSRKNGGESIVTTTQRRRRERRKNKKIIEATPFVRTSLENKKKKRINKTKRFLFIKGHICTPTLKDGYQIKQTFFRDAFKWSENIRNEWDKVKGKVKLMYRIVLQQSTRRH